LISLLILITAVAKISRQIGIKNPPRLLLERVKYNNIKKKFGFVRGIGLRTSGKCHRESKTIFVNTRLRWFCREKHLPSGKIITQHVKPRFEDFYRVLVHEVSLRHGYAFEQRVTAILRGKKYD
jgi:hypothetical protein